MNTLVFTFEQYPLPFIIRSGDPVGAPMFIKSWSMEEVTLFRRFQFFFNRVVGSLSLLILIRHSDTSIALSLVIATFTIELLGLSYI